MVNSSNFSLIRCFFFHDVGLNHLVSCHNSYFLAGLQIGKVFFHVLCSKDNSFWKESITHCLFLRQTRQPVTQLDHLKYHEIQ